MGRQSLSRQRYHDHRTIRDLQEREIEVEERRQMKREVDQRKIRESIRVV